MPSGSVSDTISLNRGNLTYKHNSSALLSTADSPMMTNILQNDQWTVDTSDGVVSDSRLDRHHPGVWRL